jgi:hypothetical protein
MISFEEKICSCSSLIQAVERIEFQMLKHDMHEERSFTRLLKRALIFKQTQYWNELEVKTKPKSIFKAEIKLKKKRRR